MAPPLLVVIVASCCCCCWSRHLSFNGCFKHLVALSKHLNSNPSTHSQCGHHWQSFRLMLNIMFVLNAKFLFFALCSFFRVLNHSTLSAVLCSLLSFRINIFISLLFLKKKSNNNTAQQKKNNYRENTAVYERIDKNRRHKYQCFEKLHREVK